jgi:hypothetical protein
LTTWPRSQRPVDFRRPAVRWSILLEMPPHQVGCCPIARPLDATYRIGWRRAPGTLAIDRGWRSPQKPVARVSKLYREANPISGRIRERGQRNETCHPR